MSDLNAVIDDKSGFQPVEYYQEACSQSCFVTVVLMDLRQLCDKLRRVYMNTNTRMVGLTTATIMFLALSVIGVWGQGVKNAHLVPVPEGAKQRVQGVISTREGDSFRMRDPSGVETNVVLTPETKVSTHRKLMGKDYYPVTYLIRGLRVQAHGVGDANGNLVAHSVRFDEKDLRAAQAVEETNELAEENAARLKEAEEANRKLAAQIEETTAMAQLATAKADAAQATANDAFKDAAMANNRINGLDTYDLVKTIPVLFGTGSSALTPSAKAGIDEAAAWARAEKEKGNTNGWLVQVVGFADTTGDTARNRSLSSRRAKTVIDYLVLKYDMDLRRLVQPYGYGDSKPIASNKTAAGRAQNRRVEIRILQNRGIANKAG
jgi:outer membrane protein OmpA-like peptidoglycan-associated protein